MKVFTISTDSFSHSAAVVPLEKNETRVLLHVLISTRLRNKAELYLKEINIFNLMLILSM